MLLSRGAVQRNGVRHDGLLPMVDRVMSRNAEVPAFLADLQTRLSWEGR
tara:strand:- start:1068 stop:1214 length:147 start_codon:yes stop_codon:yes gene_type:complete